MPASLRVHLRQHSALCAVNVYIYLKVSMGVARWYPAHLLGVLCLHRDRRQGCTKQSPLLKNGGSMKCQKLQLQKWPLEAPSKGWSALIAHFKKCLNVSNKHVYRMIQKDFFVSTVNSCNENCNKGELLYNSLIAIRIRFKVMYNKKYGCLSPKPIQVTDLHFSGMF